MSSPLVLRLLAASLPPPVAGICSITLSLACGLQPLKSDDKGLNTGSVSTAHTTDSLRRGECRVLRSLSETKLQSNSYSAPEAPIISQRGA